MSRRAVRGTRAGSIPLSVLFWLGVVSAASGIGRLLTGLEWLGQLALAAGIVLAVPAVVRVLRAPSVLPPVLAGVTAASVVTAMFVPDRALLFVIPTPNALADGQALAARGFSSIAQQGLPAVADDGIVFLLVAGVVVLAWAIDLLAFSVRLPAAAGIFLAALLAVPAVIDPADVSWQSLVLTSLIYAAILAVSARPKDPAAQRPTLASAAPSVAVVGVVVLAAGALSGAATGYARISSSPSTSGALFNGSINPIVALGADLRRPDPVTVLRYTTESDSPVYLRVLTISEFEGENWAPSETEETAPISAPIAPEGLTESVPRVMEEVEVSVETLRSRWLPVPYPVSSLDGVGGGWLQDVQDGSIRGDGMTRAGDEYEVTTLRLAPDPQQLVNAPVPTGFDRYLALPDDVPEIVGTTASEVTAEDANAYDRARSLQAYFRSSEFTYSEDTPAEEGYDGDGVGVLEAFLTVREGYCVTFASAMAVMARQLGIPARLAIGYQPGSAEPSADSEVTTYRVMSSDLHSWPELYFEGVGWLPFEPTPGRGAPASYTLPSATSSSGSVAPQAVPTTAAGEEPEASATPATNTPTPTAIAGGAVTTGMSSAPVVTAWILLAFLFLVPWLLRANQRAGRRRAATRGSTESAWAELLASARDLGIPVERSGTPRAQERALMEALGRDEQAVSALQGLRWRLEQVRYAPVASGDKTTWAATSRVVAALHASAGIPRRLLATVLPRSAAEALTRIRSSQPEG